MFQFCTSTCRPTCIQLHVPISPVVPHNSLCIYISETTFLHTYKYMYMQLLSGWGTYCNYINMEDTVINDIQCCTLYMPCVHVHALILVVTIFRMYWPHCQLMNDGCHFITTPPPPFTPWFKGLFTEFPHSRWISLLGVTLLRRVHCTKTSLLLGPAAGLQVDFKMRKGRAIFFLSKWNLIDFKGQNQSKCWYTCQGISDARKSRTLSNLISAVHVHVSTFTGQNELTVVDW